MPDIRELARSIPPLSPTDTISTVAELFLGEALQPALSVPVVDAEGMVLVLHHCLSEG